MSKRICGRCKSANVVEIGSYCGSTYYSCKNCHDWGEKDQFPEQTIFHRITASPEVLAAEFVEMMYDRVAGDYRYYSMLTGEFYNSREEAIAATVEKLKEVCNE